MTPRSPGEHAQTTGIYSRSIRAAHEVMSLDRTRQCCFTVTATRVDTGLARGSCRSSCPESFGPWVRARGIEHRELGEGLQALMVENGANFERSLAGTKRYFTEQLLAQALRVLETASGADAIVGTAMAWSASSVGEKLGIPAREFFPSSCAPRASIRLH